MGKMLTHEDFLKKLADKNTHKITILGKYQGSTTPILARCEEHNFEWTPTPNSLLQGNGCTLCRQDYGKSQKLQAKYNFENQVHITNPYTEILGEYVDSKTHIKCKCKKCGHVWESLPSNLLNGYACIKCSGNKKKTTEEYQKCVTDIFPNIKVIGEYKAARFKVKHQCCTCGYIWETKPTHILSRHGCPRCNGCAKKSHEQYVEELQNITSTIEVLDKYVNTITKIKHRCLICGHIWEAKPANLLHLQQGCPQCKESHGEKQITEYLKQVDVEFIPQYKFSNCKNIKSLPFDFYLPEYNLCIEYDGLQHYKPIEFFGGEKEFLKRQQNDNIKTDFCEKNNINLIRIRYDDDIVSFLDDYFITIQNDSCM